MPLEIITNYITITDNMDAATRLVAESSNKTVEEFSKMLKESPVNKLDPKDGRIFRITLTSKIENIMDIKREAIFPTNQS